MYVDKRLSGVATVQTLSRLNRIYKRGTVENDWTVVLDFVNDPESILADFQKYYSAASLPTGTDPNLIYSLESKLDAAGIYLESEVDAFASFYWDPKRKKDSHFQLQKYLGPPCDRFKQQYLAALNEDNHEAKDMLEIFAKDIGSFTKLFEFISQIYDFAGDAALEKRYSFFKELSPILWNIIREGRDSQVIDLSDVRLSHYAIHPSDKGIGSLEPDKAAEFEPAFGEIGSAASHDPERVKLQELIDQLNLIFEGELSDNDLVNYAYGVRDKLMENGRLRTQALNNTKKQFDESDELLEAILSAVEAQDAVNSNLASQVMGDPRVRASFIQVIRDLAYEGFRKEAV